MIVDLHVCCWYYSKPPPPPPCLSFSLKVGLVDRLVMHMNSCTVKKITILSFLELSDFNKLGIAYLVWCIIGGFQYCKSTGSLMIPYQYLYDISGVFCLQTPSQPLARLFVCCIFGERLTTEEIFHFSQADLYEKDIMLLDASTQVRFGCH